LSKSEASELARCEEIIKECLDTFMDVGNALLIIRDQRLYRTEFASFDDYLRTRWKISRSRGYQLIESARIAGDLREPLGKTGQAGENGQEMSTVEDITPERESQVRPLAGIGTREERQMVWKAAVAGAGGGQPTAAQVEQARRVTVMVGKPDPEPRRVTSYRVVEGPKPKPRTVHVTPIDPITEALEALDVIGGLRSNYGYGHIRQLNPFFDKLNRLVDKTRADLLAKR
jgi:hypothetical protein